LTSDLIDQCDRAHANCRTHFSICYLDLPSWVERDVVVEMLALAEKYASRARIDISQVGLIGWKRATFDALAVESWTSGGNE
jgi:hypothetical protein